jgi:hypothetical protein
MILCRTVGALEGGLEGGINDWRSTDQTVLMLLLLLLLLVSISANSIQVMNLVFFSLSFSVDDVLLPRRERTNERSSHAVIISWLNLAEDELRSKEARDLIYYPRAKSKNITDRLFATRPENKVDLFMSSSWMLAFFKRKRCNPLRHNNHLF